MFENKVIITNINKFSGGEIQAISKTGIRIFDFSQTHLIMDCDMVLIFSGGQEQSKMLDAIPKLPKNITLGWWMCDFRTADYFDDSLSKSVDYMFVPYYNYHDGFMKLAKKDVYYMPQPGNVWAYKNNIPINWDCVFIGNTIPNIYHANRKDILDCIARHSKLHIINEGNITANQSYIYKNTPISISISTTDMIGGSSNRLYNILASGGFAFVRYFDKIEEMFTNHKHLVWYNSIEEIPDLLNLYLSNTNKIDEIKLNALNIFNSAHSAEHRLHNIFSIMDGTCNDFLGKICP